MTVPDIAQTALGDEDVAARVNIGEDALFVTPTRSVLYRADKLLSDESVEEFPHGAERVELSEGRRKSTITLDYGLDGERSFTLPTKYVDEVLHPVVAGVLNAAGITEAGETVKQTYRFSELTFVITSNRVVKHVGQAVWDEEFEEFPFENVTNLAFEEGSVATTIVLSLGRRQERFKTPNDQAREVSEGLTAAVLEYHGVPSLDALREQFADEEEEERSATMSFGEGPTPLSVNPRELSSDPANATTRSDADDATPTTETPVDAGANRPPTATTEAVSTAQSRGRRVDVIDTEASDASADDGTSRDPVDTGTSAESADVSAIAAEVSALRTAVEEQNERLARQEALIDRLIEELRDRA